jgi:hypothetical protein
MAFFSDAGNRNAEVKNVLINESIGLSVIEVHYSLDHKGKGHLEFDEVLVQKWRDGKIIHERMYVSQPHLIEDICSTCYGQDTSRKAVADYTDAGAIAA